MDILEKFDLNTIDVYGTNSDKDTPFLQFELRTADLSEKG